MVYIGERQRQNIAYKAAKELSRSATSAEIKAKAKELEKFHVDADIIAQKHEILHREHERVSPLLGKGPEEGGAKTYTWTDIKGKEHTYTSTKSPEEYRPEAFKRDVLVRERTEKTFARQAIGGTTATTVETAGFEISGRTPEGLVKVQRDEEVSFIQPTTRQVEATLPMGAKFHPGFVEPLPAYVEPPEPKAPTPREAAMEFFESGKLALYGGAATLVQQLRPAPKATKELLEPPPKAIGLWTEPDLSKRLIDYKVQRYPEEYEAYATSILTGGEGPWGFAKRSIGAIGGGLLFAREGLKDVGISISKTQFYKSYGKHIKEGIVKPFYEWPTAGLATTSVAVGKPLESLFLKSRRGYESTLRDIEAFERKRPRAERFLAAPKAFLKAGEFSTGVLSGFAGKFVTEPRKTYPHLLGGALISGLVGAGVAKGLVSEKAVRIGTKGLGILYAGGVVLEAAFAPAGLPREQLIGGRLQPIVLFGIGAKIGQRFGLQESVWESMAKGPKTEAGLYEHPTKYFGLGRAEARQYMWAEEGRPVLASFGAKRKIIGREAFIESGALEKVAGTKFTKSLLARSEDLRLFTRASGLGGLKFFGPSVDIKSVVRKTEIDFSIVKRLAPVGVGAPSTVSAFFKGYVPRPVLGGSIVPSQVYAKEFAAAGIEPHDIDAYIKSIGISGAGKFVYKSLGGKMIPKKVDIDMTKGLDVYKQFGLKVTKKLGGRVGGAMAMQLQVPSFGRTAADIDVEFGFGSGAFKTSPAKISKKYFGRLEKKFGKGMFEIEAGRHAKIVWKQPPKDSGYDVGQTFIDIGKLRTGFSERTLKGMRMIHVEDMIKEKGTIVRLVKGDVAKVSKAKRDIFATKVGLKELYQYGTLRLDVKDKASAKLFAKELTEPKKWNKLMEIHGTKEMLFPNIEAVTPIWRGSQSYILKTKGGIGVLSPVVQKRRAVVGAFADLRYKDVPKFIAMQVGDIRLAKARAKESVFGPTRIKQLKEQQKILSKLKKGQMYKLAILESRVEELQKRPITLPVGKRTMDVFVPGRGGLPGFERRYGSKALEELFRTPELKRLGPRRRVESFLREPLPKKGKYPSYDYYAGAYPLAYAGYKPTKPPKYPKYDPYKAYPGYGIYKPYDDYKPYTPLVPYRPYKPYTGYKPYKPSAPYKPYGPYAGYKPYKPTAPYRPYKPYDPYKDVPPPPELFLPFPGVVPPKKKKKGKRGRAAFRYLPSLGPVAKKMFGVRPKFLTGLEPRFL